jgi:hypothetical protein
VQHVLEAVAEEHRGDQVDLRPVLARSVGQPDLLDPGDGLDRLADCRVAAPLAPQAQAVADIDQGLAAADFGDAAGQRVVAAHEVGDEMGLR